MFTNIDHVAFVVEDMDEAMDYFESVYGLELQGTNSDEHREAHGIDAAFYEAGESVLELISPIREDSWAYEHMQEHGQGFFHIAYAVDDIRKRMDELEEKGIRFESDEPGKGFSGEIITLNPEDTFVPTQLVEPFD